MVEWAIESFAGDRIWTALNYFAINSAKTYSFMIPRLTLLLCLLHQGSCHSFRLSHPETNTFKWIWLTLTILARTMRTASIDLNEDTECMEVDSMKEPENTDVVNKNCHTPLKSWVQKELKLSQRTPKKSQSAPLWRLCKTLLASLTIKQNESNSLNGKWRKTQKVRLKWWNL